MKPQINMNGSYKLGMDEVVGLRQELECAFSPVLDLLKDKTYWNDGLEFDELEYKSRDGFIPHSHNCGGLELGIHVPECESRDWDCLSFGEAEIDPETEEPYENEGELDAYLRIILKFEGFDEQGYMMFYINACGGNEDAPYFRVKHLPDLFEASFRCKTLAQIVPKSRVHIRKLCKMLGGK